MAMDIIPPYQPRGTEKPDDLTEETLGMLNKEFIVVGKRRIKSSTGWITIGAALGAAMAVIFMANRSIQFESTLATPSAPVHRGQPSPDEKNKDIEELTDQIIIKFKPAVSSSKKNQLLASNNLKEKADIPAINIKVATVSADDTAQEIIERLKAKNKDSILFAEIDRKLPPTFIPSDSQYTSQWHHPKINSPAAWDLGNGTNITVGIADSGVDPAHPDLTGHLVLGRNFYDNNDNTSDVYGHGTKVAGTQSAIGNNAAQVAGVAWNTKIMPLRVTDTAGYGYSSTISSAITYAADRGAKTVNVSFGGVCTTSSIASAASYMRQKGGWVVASAGNSGADSGCSASPDIIFAAATDSTDNRASWSTYGNNVDISAPGVSILTTTNGGGTGSVFGTY